MPEAPPWYKRAWIWACFGILLLLAPMGLHLSRQVGDRDWWEREARAYNRRYAVPDEENAATVYRDLRLTGPDGRTFSRKDWSLPAGTSDLAMVASQEEGLSGLLQATRLPHCFLPLDPRVDPAFQPLPHLQKSKTAAQLLLLKARVEAGQNQPEAAADSLLALARLGFQERHGFLISHLSSIAVRRMAWQGMERLAMDVPSSPETLEATAKAVESLSGRRLNAAEFWESERLSNRGEIECLYRPGTHWQDLISGTSSPGSLGNRVQGAGFWLWMALTEPIERSRVESDGYFNLLSRETLSAADRARLKALPAKAGRLNRLLLPSLDMAAESRQRELAEEGGTRILLLLRAHRLRHGSYPESLEALGTPLPEDPYGGKSFVYKKRRGDAFSLYSLGPDGIDAGGMVDGRDNYTTPPGTDLLFGRPPIP